MDDRARKVRLARLLEERRRRQKYNKLRLYFPDETTEFKDEEGNEITFFARHHYPKQLEHFAAGQWARERCFRAANRVGKTIAGTYEDALHLTGWYPDWWEGRVFERPIKSWVAGKTKESTRDILQLELMGPRGDFGAGMIPKDCIKDYRFRPQSGGGLDYVIVKRSSAGDVQGGDSYLGFKSYDQGIDSFMGTALHAVHLDEEGPMDIYSECVTRTATTKGIVICTFTPLKGISPIVMHFDPRYQTDAEMDAYAGSF